VNIPLSLRLARSVSSPNRLLASRQCAGLSFSCEPTTLIASRIRCVETIPFPQRVNFLREVLWLNHRCDKRNSTFARTPPEREPSK